MGKRKFDVGIVVPLKEEFRYIVEVAPNLESIPHEGTYFYSLDFGKISAVCSFAGQMGSIPALQITTRLLGFADIKLLVVLGLGGALDDDVAVGDVVVATEVNDFLANSKAMSTGEGYEFQYSGRHWPLDFGIREALSHFEFSGDDAFINWQTHCSGDYNKLGIPDKENICSSPPSLHLGPIASGNVVAASSVFVEEIKRIDRKFVAIDMEAAGVASAATERIHPLPFLVIRGISDHANEEKKTLDMQGEGAWRRYCVRNATSFLRNLLTWEGFLNATGLPTSKSPSSSKDVASELVVRLNSCVGGPWIIGVAFDLYTYGPSTTDGGAIIPMDLSRLRVSDARVSKIMGSASQLKEDLLVHGGLQLAADGFARLVEDFRNQLSSTEADSLLQDFDRVVQEILCPESKDEQVEAVLLESDKLEEEAGPEAVIELLSGLVNEAPRLRERYVEVLAGVNMWPVIVETVSHVEHSQLSRRELEHALFAYAKMGSFDIAIEIMKRHRNEYDDRFAKIFRQEVSRQYPEFRKDAPGDKS